MLRPRYTVHSTLSETLYNNFTKLCNRRAISINRMLNKMVSDEVLSDEMEPKGFPIARTSMGITIAEVKEVR